MIKHTKACGTFKDEAERLLNFVALISHAVPVLRRVIIANRTATQVVATKPADNFRHDKSSDEVLEKWILGYDEELARLIVITIFSYFEAYVKAALQEIMDFHGGVNHFSALAVRRASRFITSPSQNVINSKRKLQEKAKEHLRFKYENYTKNLVGENFRFPSEIFSAYGVLCVKEKLGTKDGVKAWEIPNILGNALLFKITPAQRSFYDEIRELRNQIAHGKTPPVNLNDAIKKTASLRKWVVRIDEHIVENFLVIERFAP